MYEVCDPYYIHTNNKWKTENNVINDVTSHLKKILARADSFLESQRFITAHGESGLVIPRDGYELIKLDKWITFDESIISEAEKDIMHICKDGGSIYIVLQFNINIRNFYDLCSLLFGILRNCRDTDLCALSSNEPATLYKTLPSVRYGSMMPCYGINLRDSILERIAAKQVVDEKNTRVGEFKMLIEFISEILDGGEYEMWNLIEKCPLMQYNIKERMMKQILEQEYSTDQQKKMIKIPKRIMNVFKEPIDLSTVPEDEYKYIHIIPYLMTNFNYKRCVKNLSKLDDGEIKDFVINQKHTLEMIKLRSFDAGIDARLIAYLGPCQSEGCLYLVFICIPTETTYDEYCKNIRRVFPQMNDDLMLELFKTTQKQNGNNCK